MQTITRTARLLSLVLLSVLGTSVLMYAAPGYFADAREMDGAHAAQARQQLDHIQQQQSSMRSLLEGQIRSWARGDLGRSRQYDAPVSALLRERAWRSARLLAAAIAFAWSASLLVAIPFSMRQSTGAQFALAGLTSVLLAIPVGLLATVCLLTNTGGATFVLAVVVAARDCKLLHRLLCELQRAPFLLHAHAQGMPALQIVRVHIAPALKREVLSIAAMSFTLALSALVPVEVVFDAAGLGQLAWGAAMNRDLPVLVAVTAIMSTAVGLAAALISSRRTAGAGLCA